MELLKKILSARKEPAKTPGEIHGIIANLRLLSKGEDDIAEFYRLCGDLLEDDKAFWHGLAASERMHAETAARMADLIEKNPGEYRAGRSFNPAVARVFRMHVKTLVERMCAGKVRKDELLSLAVEVESSVVELSYGDLVKTDEPEYRAMARMLEEESGEHREALEKRMGAR